MSPEAIARLREMARLVTGKTGSDLRALLDAHAALEAEKEREWQAHLAEKVTFVSEIADLKAALEKIRVIAWATACPKGHVYDDCHCRSDEAGRIAAAVLTKSGR